MTLDSSSVCVSAMGTELACNDTCDEPTGKPRGLLVDFGGVLTTSVFAAFAEFSAAVSSDPNLVQRLLAEDAESSRLLVEHESGRLDEVGFDRGFAARLRAHGATVEDEGVIARMQAGLRPDPAMLKLVTEMRGPGRARRGRLELTRQRLLRRLRPRLAGGPGGPLRPHRRSQAFAPDLRGGVRAAGASRRGTACSSTTSPATWLGRAGSASKASCIRTPRPRGPSYAACFTTLSGVQPKSVKTESGPRATSVVNLTLGSVSCTVERIVGCDATRSA